MFFEHFLAFRRKNRRKMQTRTLGQLAQFDFLLYFCSTIDNYPDYLGCLLFVRIHEWIGATRKLLMVGSQIRFNTFTHK